MNVGMGAEWGQHACWCRVRVYGYMGVGLLEAGLVAG